LAAEVLDASPYHIDMAILDFVKWQPSAILDF